MMPGCYAGNASVGDSKSGVEAVSKREPLNVESAQQLLVEGQNLPIDPQLFAALQNSLDVVQNWESRLEEVGQRQVQTTPHYFFALFYLKSTYYLASALRPVQSFKAALIIH